jgi:hypothetical protein
VGVAIGPAVPAAEGDEHAAENADATSAAEFPGGLMVAQDGYTLDLLTRAQPARRQAEVAMRILGPDGAPVRDFAVEHGKRLHLLAVRRDLTGYQHVHPEMDSDGTWRVPLDTSVPGVYRVFADLLPAGREDGLTLGADLTVAGAYAPKAFPAPSRTATVDGYDVELAGDLRSGTESPLRLTVSQGRAPVTDLDPYLEAYGHLVVLRDGDLAYLHVHPAGSPDDGTTKPGPTVEFFAAVPGPGRYRLFLDFSHRGVVRTAEFTLTATGPAADEPSAEASEHGDDDGHGEPR